MADSLPASQEPVRQKPAGGFSFKQMLPTLVFDVAMPIVAFNVLTGYGVSKLWALAAGGLFPAINNIRAWTKSRRLEPLGIIVMAFLAIGLPSGALPSGALPIGAAIGGSGSLRGRSAARAPPTNTTDARIPRINFDIDASHPLSIAEHLRPPVGSKAFALHREL